MLSIKLAERKLSRATEDLTTGRWGSSAELRSRSACWYRSAGVVADVSDGTLHPIIEYAANCRATGEEPAAGIDIDYWIGTDHHVDRGTPIPDRWSFSRSRADSELHILIAHRVESRWPLRKPSSDDLSLLHDASVLAISNSPLLAADAFSYTRRHVFVRSDRLIGRTWVDLGGVTVTGDPALTNSTELAESLFHEALHAKFYTLERGLAEPTPDEETSPTPVVIPWQHQESGESQRWTAQRAVDAFYVYTHLSLFRLALYLTSGTDRDLERLRRVCFRGEYLSRQIRSACHDILDSQRLSVAEWLDSCRLPAFDLNSQGRAMLANA